MNLIKKRLANLERSATGTQTPTTSCIRVIPVHPVSGHEVLTLEEIAALESYETAQVAMAAPNCASVVIWSREQAQRLMATPTR